MEEAYLAGIIDGEGCIFITKTKNRKEGYNYGLGIKVAMNCKKIIYEIQKIFKGNAGGPYDKNKRIYAWSCFGLEAGGILKLILPHLIEKKEQAELALDYLENLGVGRGSKVSKRNEIEKQLQELYYLKMQLLKKENIDEKEN